MLLFSRERVSPFPGNWQLLRLALSPQWGRVSPVMAANQWALPPHPQGDCFQLDSGVYQEKSVICDITQITAESGVYILEKVIYYWLCSTKDMFSKGDINQPF